VEFCEEFRVTGFLFSKEPIDPSDSNAYYLFSQLKKICLIKYITFLLKNTIPATNPH
jgi:hypothetical protein